MSPLKLPFSASSCALPFTPFFSPLWKQFSSFVSYVAVLGHVLSLSRVLKTSHTKARATHTCPLRARPHVDHDKSPARATTGTSSLNGHFFVVDIKAITESPYLFSFSWDRNFSALFFFLFSRRIVGSILKLFSNAYLLREKKKETSGVGQLKDQAIHSFNYYYIFLCAFSKRLPPIQWTSWEKKKAYYKANAFFWRFTGCPKMFSDF